MVADSAGPAAKPGVKGRSAPVFAQLPPPGAPVRLKPGSAPPLSGEPDQAVKACSVTFGPQVGGEVSTGVAVPSSFTRTAVNGSCGAFSIVAVRRPVVLFAATFADEAHGDAPFGGARVEEEAVERARFGVVRGLRREVGGALQRPRRKHRRLDFDAAEARARGAGDRPASPDSELRFGAGLEAGRGGRVQPQSLRQADLRRLHVRLVDGGVRFEGDLHFDRRRRGRVGARRPGRRLGGRGERHGRAVFRLRAFR